MTLVTLGNKIAKGGKNVKVENVKWIIREPGHVDLLGNLHPITTDTDSDDRTLDEDRQAGSRGFRPSELCRRLRLNPRIPAPVDHAAGNPAVPVTRAVT